MTSCNMFYHYFSVSDWIVSSTMGGDPPEIREIFKVISTHCKREEAIWNWKIMIEHVTRGHVSVLWPILCGIGSLSTLILRSAEIRSWGGRDWEEWDSDCHRTSDSDSSSNFDIQSMCLDIMNIFWITIVTFPLFLLRSQLSEPTGLHGF